MNSVSGLFFKITRSRNIAVKLLHILLLPGVIVHELAHLVTAEVLFVRTGGLSFELEKGDEELGMGRVMIQQTDPLRRAIIGFAPVFMGILLIFASLFYLLSEQKLISSPWNYLLLFFLVFEIGNTMFSSKKDLEGTVTLLIALILSFLALFILGFNPQNFIYSLFNSEEAVNILKEGIKILILPIGIDIIIIFFLRVLTGGR